MLVAAGCLRGRLPGRLVLAFTADEEGATGHGMEWLCEQRLVAADAAVVMAPGRSSERSWDRSTSPSAARASWS
jgi:acetylornithine deacetylase/succinyl-diaminopimelate desuccinylase-like protein